MSLLNQWLSENKDNQREFNQERLIVDVAEMIMKTLNDDGVNQVELANKLGKTKGYVSQLLNGSRNMTLRTLADIATELDKKVEFSFKEKSSDTWTRSTRKKTNPHSWTVFTSPLLTEVEMAEETMQIQHRYEDSLEPKRMSLA